MMRPTGPALSSLAVVLLVGACSSGPVAPARPTPSTVSQTQTSTHVLPKAPEVAPLIKIDLHSTVASNIRASGDEAVVGVQDGGTGNYANSVLRVGLHSGAETVVARSHWASGMIPWQVIHGPWLVWVDQSSMQSFRHPSVEWKVWAKNVVTHEQHLLSQSVTPNPYVPTVTGGQGWFAWAQAEPDRSVLELVWEPGMIAPRQVLDHISMTPGSESIDQGNLYYLGSAGTPHQGRTVGGDCWSEPLSGGVPPEALTHTALAMGCVAANGHLVWSEHFDYRAHGIPDKNDDPFSYWAKPLAGGAPSKLWARYTSSRYPVAGAGFTSWMSDSCALIVSYLSSARSTCVGTGKHANVSLGMSASGPLLVFAYEGFATRDVTLQVYRIQ